MLYIKSMMTQLSEGNTSSDQHGQFVHVNNAQCLPQCLLAILGLGSRKEIWLPVDVRRLAESGALRGQSLERRHTLSETIKTACTSLVIGKHSSSASRQTSPSLYRFQLALKAAVSRQTSNNLLKIKHLRGWPRGPGPPKGGDVFPAIFILGVRCLSLACS